MLVGTKGREIAFVWTQSGPHESIGFCCEELRQLQRGAPSLVFNRPEVTLACVPGGCLKTVFIPAGVRLQGVVAVFHASAFARRYGLQAEDLPAAVREAI
jgi:hypothetical protein